MDNMAIVNKLAEHGDILREHSSEISVLKVNQGAYDQQRIDHCTKIDSFDERIRLGEMKDVMIETKLNTTNKILLGIFTVITGAVVTFLFELFKGVVSKG